MGCHILQPDGNLALAYVPQQAQSLGRLRHVFAFFQRKATSIEVANTSQGLESQERTVPGAGEISSAVDNFLKNGFGIQVFGYFYAGFAQSD